MILPALFVQTFQVSLPGGDIDELDRHFTNPLGEEHKTMSRWVSVVGIPILGGLAIGAAFAANDNVDGIWSGKMRQVNVGSEQTYPMKLELSGAHGESDYSSLNCGGQLVRIGAANGQTVYSETITRGRVDARTGKGCIDGFIVVQRHELSLILQWSGAYGGQPYVATAVLKRDPTN